MNERCGDATGVRKAPMNETAALLYLPHTFDLSEEDVVWQ
jgi:hypothetical protein